MAVAVAILLVVWALALRPSQRSVDAAAMQLARLGVRFDSSRRPIDPAALSGVTGRAPSAQQRATDAARFDAAFAIVRRGARTGRWPSPHLLELLAEYTDVAIGIGREARDPLRPASTRRRSRLAR